MCLTRANATTLLEHRDTTPPAHGYTRTQHHAGYLSPGDLWRPDPGGQPHVVTAVSRHHDRITLTDQYGLTYPYPANGLIPTALPDPLGQPTPIRTNLGGHNNIRVNQRNCCAGPPCREPAFQQPTVHGPPSTRAAVGVTEMEK